METLSRGELVEVGGVLRVQEVIFRLRPSVTIAVGLISNSDSR
jgi:hypothetical protein